MKKTVYTKEKVFIFSIILLVFLAVVLVIVYLQKKQFSEESQIQKPYSEINFNENESGKSFSEKSGIEVTGPNAKEEELQRFSREVARIAESADFLDISGCNPRPLVIKAVNGQLKIVNRDPEDHSLNLGQNIVIKVGAGDEIVVGRDKFTRGESLYGYGCDNSQYMVGVIMLTEANPN